MLSQALRLFWADRRGRLPCRRYGDLKDRPRRLAAQDASLLTLVLGLVYLCWLAASVFRTRGVPDLLFLAAEGLAFLLLALLAFDIWRLRVHRPEGLPLRDRPAVDIFITCCGEPFPVIQTTLRAVRNISYEPVTVYVLDDGGSPQVAALARSLGFTYRSRRLDHLPRVDAKSGNLNYGLSLSQGEFILVLDADQVPQADILERMLGFFQIPQVGYVQSRQSFYLPEGDPFYNRDEIFYEVLQPANDQANAVISCGSGVIYRRQALLELGGFATWNLVEDFTTSYELISRGWKGIYFPYALTRGLAPQHLDGVYRQRFQWCLDTMRLFFWDNPLAKKGLNLSQRLHFLVIMVSYLVSGLVFPVFYLMPLLAYWQGYTCLEGQEWHYLALRGLYLGATVLMFRYLFQGKSAIKQFRMLCGLFPVYAAAIGAALLYPRGRKPAYRLNNRAPFQEMRPWHCLLPQMLVVVLHLTLPLMSLQFGWAPVKLVVFNALFSAFVIWVLADVIVVSLRQPRFAPAMDPRQVYGV